MSIITSHREKSRSFLRHILLIINKQKSLQLNNESQEVKGANLVYWLAELPEYIDAMACQRMIACIEADHDII